MTLRIGLLSTAGINRNLLATRDDSDAYAFVAVGSRDRARGEAYAREWGIPRAHGSYDALLADPEVDAVYVALPNVFHHEWTMKALAAGKHVLCEKPYTRRPELVEEAFHTARQAGLVLMEGYMWRHRPETHKLLALLPEIGELQTVRATFSFPLTDPGNVRLDPHLGGGALLDVGCYCVSAIRLVAGREPDRVYGEATAGPTGIDARFSGLLRFGGLTAEFFSGFSGPHHHGLEAIGSEGTLVLTEPWQTPSGRVLLNGKEVPVEEVSPYLLELENLAAAVRGEAEPLLGLDDALGQARTLDALLRSAKTGAPVSLA